MPVLEERKTSGETNVIYICRNKTCRAPKRVTYRHEITTTVAQSPSGGRISRETIVRYYDADGEYHRYLPYMVCPACKFPVGMKMNVVKGVLKADHKCDPRCTGATGQKCECSCSGANHGKSYS